MKRHLARLLVFVLFFSLFPVAMVQQSAMAADPQTLKIRPEADKFVDDLKGYPKGESGPLVTQDHVMFIGYEKAFGVMKGAIRFNLDPIKEHVNQNPDARIKSVMLSLNVRGLEPKGSPPFLDLFGSDDEDWTEDESRSLPVKGSQISPRYLVVSEGRQRIDVTSYVKPKVEANGKKATFVLEGNTVSDDGTRTFFFFNDSHEVNPELDTYLEVTFNSPPTDIQLSNHTVPENSLAGTEIGLLTATDPDPDETFTFTLSGTDAEAFIIQENYLLTKRPLDYETKSLYTFLIHVTNSSGGTFSKSFTIQVQDVNEPPIIESFLINDGAESTSSQKVTIKTLITDPDAGDSVQMRLSNVENEWTSAWMPYTPEYEWNLSAGEGRKTVYVQARDSAGLESQVVSRTIHLDNSPLEIAGITNGGIYNHDVTITFNKGTAKLNGVSFSSGTTVSAEKNPHIFKVTESSGAETTYQFTIDKTAPTGSFTINNWAKSTTTPDVSFAITATDGAGVGNIQMRFWENDVLKEDWTPLQSTKNWTLSGEEGSKKIRMGLRDGAGNVSVGIEQTIILDQTPPDVTTFTINNGTAYTLSRDVDLYVDIGTSEASLPVQVSVSNQEDGPFTTWNDLQSPIHWQLTPGDGTKTVYAVFRDAAGNVTAKQSATIILDTIAPVISGVSMGGAYKNDVTVTFSDSNGATAILNGVLIDSGHTITQEGQYDLIVTDSAGNTNALQFIVDKSSPVAAVQINGGATFTNQPQVHVTITAKDLTSMRMSFANDTSSGFTPEEPYVGTKTWNLSSGDGVKTVYVKLVDVLGHQTTQTASIILDTTPPIVSGVTNQAVYNTEKTIFFSEGSATLNGQSIPNGHTVSLEGEYKLVVTDEAGNVTTVQFTIIKSAPVGGFSINNGSPYTALRDVTLQIRANGSADGLQMSYNTDGAWSTFEPFSSTKHLQLPGIDGTKSVSIKFRDQAGNESQDYSQSIILDTAPPSGSFTINNGAATTSSARVNLSVAATDNLGQIEMRIANENSTWSNWQAYTRSVPWTLPNGNGSKKVLLELRDEAGNVASLEKSIVLRVLNPPPWVPVTGISLDEDRFTLLEGEGRTLIATVSPSHASNKAVIWSSSDPQVAEVKGSGVVTAKNPGDAIITATTVEGQKTASAKVTVKKAVEEVPVTGVKLDRDSLKLLVGETHKLTAIVQPNDASNQDVSWSSSHPKVASVDEEGVVTAHKAGEAAITVTTADGGKTDTAAITVRKKNDREGTLVASDSALWLSPGITTSVSIYYRNDGIRTKINQDPETRFHSENGLVTFENGRIKTGKEEGEDWITVSYLGEELIIPVTISRESIRSLSIDAGRNVILEKGGEKQLRLYGTTKNGTDPELTDLAAWTSSDPDVARVTDEGEIIAGAPGKATIKARYSGQSVTVRVLVMGEKEIREIRLSPLFLNLEEGESRQLRLYAEYEKGYDEIVSDDWDWEIEDTSIATVKDGKVKALKTGETILTVRYEGFETQVRIVVR